MKSFNLTYTFLLFLFVGQYLFGQNMVKPFQKEYFNFENDSRIQEIEDSLNVKLNSLAKVLKFGESASENNLQFFEKRIYEIAENNFKDGNGFILTWGTNGNCGRYGEWFDELTEKYGFKYLSVNCDCSVGKLPELIDSYNSYSTKFLNQTNTDNWADELENEILTKKRKIEFKYSKNQIKKKKELTELQARELIEFPKEIGMFTNLELLYLNVNHLSNIDNSICNLNKLKELNLHSNDFTKFPIEITCLKNLEFLGIDSNKLEKVPKEVNHFQNLKELVISNNKITALPEEFSELKNLETLDIRNNELSSLPENFSNLKNLKTLILWYNKFETIPEPLYQMKNLETLFLKNGNEIPKEEISELQKALPNTLIK